MSAVPTRAYELAPSGQFANAVIHDNVVTVCFGTQTTDGLYYNRFRLLEEMEQTWGHVIGFDGQNDLTFQSNGLCDQAGSNIEIVWDRSGTCFGSDSFAYAQTFPWDWLSIRIYVRADCNIQNKMDWTLSDGISAGKFSARALITHEVGHVFGIQHSSDAAAIMHPSYGTYGNCSFWGEHQRLSYDDQMAIWAEYADSNLPIFAQWQSEPYCQG